MLTCMVNKENEKELNRRSKISKGGGVQRILYRTMQGNFEYQIYKFSF